VTERRTVEKGYVGENYVIAKLIRDFNIVSVKVPQQFFAYDLITNNNKRLEVKTGKIIKSPKRHEKYGTYYSDTWEFRRSPRQVREDTSHFVVCVCFKSENFSEEPRCFIVPTKVLQGRSNNFKISAGSRRKGKYKFWEYENNWGAITKDNASGSSDIKNAEKL